MPDRWRRNEIRLGMVVTRDDVEDAEPLLYKVVAIIDSPTVVVRPLFERDGDDDEYYVIDSPLFAEFHQVRSAGEPGGFIIDFGARS